MSKGRGSIDTFDALGTNFFHFMLTRTVCLLEDKVFWPIPHGGLASFCTILVGRGSPRDVLVRRMQLVVLH